MGFAEIAELTHAMENLLDCLRSGTAPVTTNAVDFLLVSTDVLLMLWARLAAGSQCRPMIR